MSYQTLRIERDEAAPHVAVLTLDRPDRMNAFDSVMRAELPRAWEELRADTTVWCVVVTGAGERAFCTGMDLREPPPPAPPPAAPSATPPRTGTAVRLTPLDCDLGKPVIAAVNGMCAGGGLVFVADADIVIASENAVFTDARTSAGQVSIAGTLRLARKIPLEAVFRLVMLGKAERWTAMRAYQLGLVSEIVPPGELLARAKAIAATICESSPSAVFWSRHAIWESLDTGLGEALEMGWDVVHGFPRAYPDAKEGARAFVEKRNPAWEYQEPPRKGERAPKA
ncbi:MAG: enoyl-CoA hydratase/isomerase family protein [Deltaproteobacteria bacterium]|nr:enoyl-CoA hydratase/isomerase family protein [Deltaproteobacteria bacterium]